MFQVKESSNDKERELAGLKDNLEKAQKDVTKKEEIISVLREVSTHCQI